MLGTKKHLYNKIIKRMEIYKSSGGDIGEVHDGYHTFNELYYHRMILFLIIQKSYPEYSWKSKLHNDGTMYDDYFIAGIETPEGQYTYHYNMKYWDMFEEVKELDKAPKYDGHRPDDIERLFSLLEE